MKRTEQAILAAVGLVILAVPVALWLALDSQYDSTTEALIRPLHRQLLMVAITLALLVEAVLFYAAVKFHDNDDPQSTKENRRLEITWTIAVGLVLLFVGASSYVVLADPMVSTPSGAHADPGDLEVNITGQNWYWSVDYPESNVSTRNLVVLPVNRTVFFHVTSRDVIHSVHVPELGIKQDAIPGQVNDYRTRPTETGTYRLYCAEYCGAGHSKMTATVRVVNQSTYQSWIDDRRAARNGTSGKSSG